MKNIIRSWNDYWFDPAPIVNLAMARIILVAFQLSRLIAPGVQEGLAWVSKVPDFLYEPLPILHLLLLPFGWKYRPSLESLEIVHIVTILAGIFALIGLRTRISLVLFTTGSVVLQAYKYSFGEMHHPEALMMLSLAILALSPCGQALSADDLRSRVKANSMKGKFENFDVTEERSIYAKWPFLLILCMLSLIYLSSAKWKFVTGGTDWTNGYTLQYYLLNDGMKNDVPLGRWLSQFHGPVALMSWFTVLFEATFFLVLFFPVLTPFYLLLGAGFHAGIYYTMHADFFEYLAVFAIFLPWNRIFQRARFLLAPESNASLFYDGDCRHCVRSVTFLQYCNWFGYLKFKDVNTSFRELRQFRPDLTLEAARADMYLLVRDGSVKEGFFAFRHMVWHLPPLQPLALIYYFPFASFFGPLIHQLIVAHQKHVRTRTTQPTENTKDTVNITPEVAETA